MPTPPGRDLPTRYLQQAIDDYAGAKSLFGAAVRHNLRSAELPAMLLRARSEQQLGAAWAIVEPEARRTIRGRVAEIDRQDDASQLAFLKLWSAVRRYNPERGPVESAAALARWAADKTALNVVEHRDKVAGREQSGAIDDDATRDLIEYRAAEIRGGAGLDDAAAMADYARYAASRAGSTRRGKLWAAIILAVAEGHDDREAIGQAVGIPAVSVRREIWHMVRTLRIDALDKLEVLVDWRTREPAEDDTTELALFDYEWQEIS